MYYAGSVLRPTATARQKFSGKGLVKAEALIPRLKSQRTAEALAKKANFGLSLNTHKSYQTAVNHLKKCEVETGVNMSLPFNPNKTLEFLGWMEARGLKSRTMSTYLSGVRSWHIACGYGDPFLRDPMVSLILKGQDNWDKLEAKMSGKNGRLPVTKNVMKLIKKNLVKANWSLSDKRLFWSVATLAWSGAFRVHELCSRVSSEFDVQTTLLWKDISTGSLKLNDSTVKYVRVHVKSPKIDRIGTGDNIEVYEIGNYMCSIAALEKYRADNKNEEESNMPVFRFSSGECMTGSELNRRLSELTKEVKELVPGGVVTSHSFRAGMSSELARTGHDEQAIKAVGRWSSDSYKAYVKLPRTGRAITARTIGMC